MERRTLWVGVAIAFLISAAGLLFLRNQRTEMHGVVLSPPSAAGAIELTDQNERQFSLSQQRGQLVLVYFGYTDCPVECPATMAKLAQALDQLDARSAEIKVVLVTTSPDTDGAAQLKEYVERFRPDFLGLHGTTEQLQAVWSAYGVVVMDGGESHSTRTYVIDRIGNLVVTFPYEMTVDEIVSDLRQLLESN